MHRYTDPLRSYSVFAGRATRSQFWWFMVINYTIALALSWVISLLTDSVAWNVSLPTIYLVATLLPTLAIGTRRFHDTGRSGLWWLLLLIPFFGQLTLLVLSISPGDVGTNAYGPDPRPALAGAAAARPGS